jgi:hypothetical protein
MSTSFVLVELKITHEQPIPDAQIIGDLAARAITDALADDRLLLATAIATPDTREGLFTEGWMAAEKNALANLRWRGSLRQRITRAMRS